MEDSKELELHRVEWAGVKGDGVWGGMRQVKQSLLWQRVYKYVCVQACTSKMKQRGFSSNKTVALTFPFVVHFPKN